MAADIIVAIGIDANGSLWVKPAATTFPLIYRAAMEVHWDDERRCLYSPKPREWTYLDWFRHIRKAAYSEYGVTLETTPATVWHGIDEPLRLSMETAQISS